MEDFPRILFALAASIALSAGCAYGTEDHSWGTRQATETNEVSGVGGGTVDGEGGAPATGPLGEGGSGGMAKNSGNICGDSQVDAGEECDDGNAEPGDGCTSCIVDCEPGDTKDPNTYHCYRFVELKAHWEAAENDCVVWGGAPGLGHLVSIQSAEEQKLVQQLGHGHERWIGGTDLAVEDQYTWTDGQAFVFDNWRSGEPNNNGGSGGEEDCAEIEDDGQWDDQPCEKTKRYVCERSAAGQP